MLNVYNQETSDLRKPLQIDIKADDERFEENSCESDNSIRKSKTVLIESDDESSVDLFESNQSKKYMNKYIH